jgi:hypothetical protein
MATNISDELKHLILQWHTFVRKGKDWQETPIDLAGPLEACARKAARANVPGEAHTHSVKWVDFERAVLEHVDRRLQELGELKQAIEAISQLVSGSTERLEEHLEQDVWAAWLIDKAADFDNKDGAPIPIGEPIAKALAKCNILYDTDTVSEWEALSDDHAHRPATLLSKEDITLRPKYSLGQLIARQLKNSLPWRKTPADIRLTQVQKAHANTVREKQARLLHWARNHMVNASSDTPAEKLRLKAAMHQYDMRTQALADLGESANRLERLKAEKDVDQALLSLLHERIITRNFDKYLREFCPTISEQIAQTGATTGDTLFTQQALKHACAPEISTFSDTVLHEEPVPSDSESVDS